MIVNNSKSSVQTHAVVLMTSAGVLGAFFSSNNFCCPKLAQNVAAQTFESFIHKSVKYLNYDEFTCLLILMHSHLN